MCGLPCRRPRLAVHGQGQRPDLDLYLPQLGLLSSLTLYLQTLPCQSMVLKVCSPCSVTQR